MLTNVVQLHTDKTIEDFVKNSTPHNTKINKQSDWKSFTEFCSLYNYTPLPATVKTLSLYLIEQSNEEYAYATIKRRLSTISDVHKRANIPNPAADPSIKEIMDNVKRKDKKKGLSSPKSAIQSDTLMQIIDSIDTTTLIGKRDKAIFLLLFASGYRRSEFVSLDVESIQFNKLGMILTADLTKTHSFNKEKAIKCSNNQYCPVIALKEWLEASNITEGAIFRSLDRTGKGGRLTTKSIEKLIKRYIEKIGLNPNDYAGHSFRRGNATLADKRGVRESDVNSFIGWNTNMAIRYKEADKLFENPMADIMSLL